MLVVLVAFGFGIITPISTDSFQVLSFRDQLDHVENFGVRLLRSIINCRSSYYKVKNSRVRYLVE